MTFKNDWEKPSARLLVDESTVFGMVAQAWPDADLISHHVIEGGCANLNVHLVFHKSNTAPEQCILRIYLRDRDAACREQKLSLLVHHKIPVSQIFFVGGYGEFRYALVEYLPGITLRALLLDHQDEYTEGGMKDLLNECGRMLGIFQTFPFPQGGFLDQELEVTSPFTQKDLLTFVKECLTNEGVIKELGVERIHQISQLPLSCQDFFPDETAHALVHGDYDPSNILVNKDDEGKWQISGILDWEFAFSGSWLWDVANMLRYAHHMPKIYEESFLQGIESSGLILPEHWRETVSLLNLFSLLDCLKRCPQDSFRQRKDIVDLISYLFQRLVVE